jgi:hypothetical protein
MSDKWRVTSKESEAGSQESESKQKLRQNVILSGAKDLLFFPACEEPGS